MKRYMIVGDGAAGLTAARALRLADDDARITMVADDPHPTYYRAALTNYLLGELRDEQLWAVPPTFFRDYRIERHHQRVLSIDTQRSALRVSGTNEPIPYDALLIGSGARCRPAPFAQAELPGVCVMRSLQDTRWILDQMLMGGVQRAAIVGGGPLAIEWALATHERGVHATLLVRDQRVMGRALDPVGSDLVLARLQHAGIEVRTGAEVAQCVPNVHGRLAGAVLKDGQQLPCQLLGVAIGVIPNTEFVAESGIALGRRKGIQVDASMKSSAPHVYAAGDCTEGDWPTVQLWETARRQASVAAANMVGSTQVYRPGSHYFATRLGDLDFASVGDVEGGEGCTERVDHPLGTGSVAYRKVVLKGDRLVGALMLGQRQEKVRARGRLFQKLIERQLDVSSVVDDLLDTRFDLAGWMRNETHLGKPRATSFVPIPTGQQPAVAPAVEDAPPNAVLRGTQALKIAAALQQASGAPIAVAAKPSPQGGTSMLSIGLRAPAEPAPLGDAVEAWLEGGGQRWPLGKRVVDIGRGAGSDILLQEEGVSHLHAQLSFHQGGFWIRDCGSRTGTWVAGRALSVPRQLSTGDTVRIGQTTLTFHQQGQDARAVANPASSHGGLHLAVSAGPSLGLTFALGAAEQVLGRDAGADLRIDDPSVSRRHAMITHHAGQWLVTDLSSSRGTLVNGTRLDPGHEQPLNAGDHIQIGDTVLVLTPA